VATQKFPLKNGKKTRGERKKRRTRNDTLEISKRKINFKAAEQKEENTDPGEPGQVLTADR